MEITWYGRACFRLKGKDATVITDPCPPSTGFVAGKHDVELLTISHDHPDHSYTRSITAGLTLTRPGEYETSDLLVTGIRTFHDGEGGRSRGENMVFAVEIDGVHIRRWETDRWPRFSLERLDDPSNLQKLVAVLDRIADETRMTVGSSVELVVTAPTDSEPRTVPA